MATGTILTPAVIIGSAAFQQIGVAVPAAKVRSYWLRAVLNTGVATVYAQWRLNNGTLNMIRGPAAGYPITYQAADSAPDLEQNLLLPAGWYLEVLALNVTFTLTGVEDDA